MGHSLTCSIGGVGDGRKLGGVFGKTSGEKSAGIAGKGARNRGRNPWGKGGTRGKGLRLESKVGEKGKIIAGPTMM